MVIFVSKTSNANKIKFTVLSISPATWRELQRKLFSSLNTQTLSVKLISGITLPTGLFFRVAWREADTMVTSGRRPEHKGVDMSCELSPQNRHEWPPLSPALAPHVNPTSQQPVQGRPTDFFLQDAGLESATWAVELTYPRVDHHACVVVVAVALERRHALFLELITAISESSDNCLFCLWGFLGFFFERA